MLRLPADPDAEKAVLGAVLTEPARLPDVASIVGVADFYADVHRRIYQAIEEVDARGEAPDVVAVAAEARRLREPVDPLVIRTLAAECPMPFAAATYAKAVARVAGQRRLIQAASQAMDLALVDGVAPDQIATEAADRMLAAVREQVPSAPLLSDLVSDALDEIESAGSGSDLIRTGFRDLDKLLTGLQRGQLVIIASRPGVGKSAFVTNLVRKVGARVAVTMFSLEMSAYEVTMRLLCSEADLSFAKLREGAPSPEAWSGLADASEKLLPLPIRIIDSAQLRLPEIRTLARRTPGLGLIVVDYLQLMTAPGASRSTRQEEVANISRGLKVLAKELDVVVVACCQLNREPERRQDKRPQLSDLRESGALEMDSDVVVLLHRNGPEAEATVAKHRNGPTGRVKLTFWRDQMKFVDHIYGDGVSEEEV